MLSDRNLQVSPTEWPEFLRRYRFLDNYGLAVYCRKHGQLTCLGSGFSPCGDFARGLTCEGLCGDFVKKTLKLSLGRNKALAFRCRTGLLNFVVPLAPDGLNSYCLVGGSVREESVDLSRLESLARSANMDAFELLSKMEALPVASLSDVKDTVSKVSRIVSSFQKDHLRSGMPDKTESLLKTVTTVSLQLDNCGTGGDAVQLLGEALGILFDLPKIAIALLDDNEDVFTVRMQHGLSGECQAMPGGAVREIFVGSAGEHAVLMGKNIKHYFPRSDSASALFLPIQNGDELAGLVVLFDAELYERDIRMVELLVCRLSSKLMLTRDQELQANGNSLADKLKSLADSVSSAENKADLFRRILEASADMLQASAGSLMLAEEDGRYLRIESVIGLNTRIAQSVKSEIGEGISGKVAASGEPMLVSNIEEDERTATRNRHRFKTKSFISAPLKVKGKTMGVLNLSDKKNGAAFTGRDLDLLCSILCQAALGIERTLSEEKANRLEQLSMADPVTGLFNERFLELRLEEELNRGGRSGESLALMLVDLDGFGAYNDICGDGLGNRALKKTALLLKAASRQMDTVTRVAGGRFCLIVPGASRSESLIVAERIRSKIECSPFPHEEKLAAGRLTASVGISLFPENGDTAPLLLQSAAEALERAKIAGRNRVVHCPTEMGENKKVVPIHGAPRKG